MAVRPQTENVSQLRIETIGRTVHIAIGGRAHIAAFAAESGPATLRRTDDAVKHSEGIKNAVIGANLPDRSVLAQIERDRGQIARAVDDAIITGCSPRANGETKTRTMRDCRGASFR